jgi:twinkle protein
MNDVQAFIYSLHVDDTERVHCPSCSPERKKKRLKEMVITRMDNAWVYHCHHCGISGNVFIEKPRLIMEKTLAVVPSVKIDQSKLEEKHYEFLKSRGISKETADRMKLFAAEKYFSHLSRNAASIGFPYFRGGQMVAAKYRCIDDKAFTQDSGGAHDFFGIDLVDKAKPLIIVEGEIDALTGMECGIENIVSVPGGAPIKVSDGKIPASEDRKFAFVWNAWEILSAVPYVVIATDSDGPGQALAEELARRIGKAKCRLTHCEKKDLNELLMQDGDQAVRALISAAEPYPVDGLSHAGKYSERLNDLWGKGTGKGFSTGYSTLDQIYTVAPSQVTVVTGYPGHGKSNFVDQLAVNLASEHDWKFAVCSFENQPEIHISRLMEIYLGKRFFDGVNRMTEEERDKAFNWVEEHFLFLDSESVGPATIESILDRAQAAVARMGVRGLIIDPYNYIDMRNRGESETAAISDMLTRVQAFAKAFGVHVWFVAHPAKVTRSGMDLPRPDGMQIAGSMAWWAKADCGLTVHRAEDGVQVCVWKSRYRWVGQTGETLLSYDRNVGTYSANVDAF